LNSKIPKTTASKKKNHTAVGNSKSEMKKKATAEKKNRAAAVNSKSMHHFFGKK